MPKRIAQQAIPNENDPDLEAEQKKLAKLAELPDEKRTEAAKVVRARFLRQRQYIACWSHDCDL